MKWLAALLLVAPLALAAPTPAEVKAAYRSSSVALLDRHGVALESVRIDMAERRASWVALADISPALGTAVLQAEDQHFAEHGGVDLGAVGKVAWDNLFARKPRGASTITMQLAALLDPKLRAGLDGRSWGQKWDQALAARELEKTWSKPQILEAYLNLVPFRGELTGIGAAARALFNKAPSGLNVNEAAILASLLRGPSASPKVVSRRACVLLREQQAGANCASIAFDTEVALGRPAVHAAPPLLARKLKTARVTTLDAGLQAFGQAALRRHLLALAERNAHDGALIVIDNASGEVLAYVGNANGGEVDGAAALRQAGSTLKPFLYSLAIERGLLTAASPLDDSPIDVATAGGLYVPQNYDRQYQGFVSVRTSLASSLNIPAVRTLMMTGLDRFYERLHAVGLESLTEPADFYGYSLALGSADVSLFDLTNSYRTLANGGRYSEASFVTRAGAGERRAIDAQASFIVADILADRGARSLTFGLSNELATTFWSAVKTGTSKDMRDNWCVGFSSRYTVGVWVGNFDGSSMWDVSGVSGAAPVWRDVMDYLHRQTPSRAPAPPPGVIAQAVRYAPAVEPERREWFVRGSEAALIEVVAPQQRHPAIVYPAPSMLVALDPDIPPAQQRMLFQAQAGRGLNWRLDGDVVGEASRDLPWQPRPGAHRLELVDAAEAVIASVKFEVRGQ